MSPVRVPTFLVFASRTHYPLSPTLMHTFWQADWASTSKEEGYFSSLIMPFKLKMIGSDDIQSKLHYPI